MKRDFEQIRKLLFWLDEKPGPEVASVPAIEGYDELTIKYHLLLLAQAELIDHEPEFSAQGRIIQVHPFNLTWKGHEFLDAIRENSVWNKVKTKASSLGVSLSFEVIKTLSIQALSSVLKG